MFSSRTLCTIFTILLTLWNSEQKNGLLIKLFCFSSDFDETWWSCSYPCVLPFHQVSSKSDEKQKSFINSRFFCSEFQSVSRIVKIVHSVYCFFGCSKRILFCLRFWYNNFFKKVKMAMKMLYHSRKRFWDIAVYLGQCLWLRLVHQWKTNMEI